MRMRILLTLFTYCACVAPLPAQDEAAEPAADQASEPIIITDDETKKAEPAEDDSGAADARAEGDDDRFIPSRETDPDEQVIFPIDI